MSVNASIVTHVENNVLTVPNSAIKTQGAQSYVQELVSGAPENIPVTIGVSNSTITEILSGLSEGDQIITKTTNSGGGTATQSTASALSLFGAGRGGGAAARVTTGR